MTTNQHKAFAEWTAAQQRLARIKAEELPPLRETQSEDDEEVRPLQALAAWAIALILAAIVGIALYTTETRFAAWHVPQAAQAEARR